jgi:hypothetical protein
MFSRDDTPDDRTRYGTDSGRDGARKLNFSVNFNSSFGANRHGTRYDSEHFCCPLRSWSIEDLKGDRRKLAISVIAWLLCLTLCNWQPRGTYEAAATIWIINNAVMCYRTVNDISWRTSSSDSRKVARWLCNLGIHGSTLVF